MTFWDELLANQVLMSAVTGWVVAQVLKTIIDLALNKSFNPERLVGSGGYAQLHSATVCGMTTAAALHYGVGSFEFAVCFILSMVVMYDAMGVRRETGKQAKLLNSILLENPTQAERRSFAGEAEGIRWTYAASGGGRCYSWHCSRRVYGAVLLTAVLHGQKRGAAKKYFR